MQNETTHRYRTGGGFEVLRRVTALEYEGAVEPLTEALNHQRGVVLSSGFDYPGRYQRWDVGFVNPPLVITGRGRNLRIDSLNERGDVLLSVLMSSLPDCEAVLDCEPVARGLKIQLRKPEPVVYEEDRSRQHTVFSVLRFISQLFHNESEAHLGLYGAFGYDLVFQFESIRQRLARDPHQRDLVLYLPDELIVVDHQRKQAYRQRYDFLVGQRNTFNLRRCGAEEAFSAAPPEALEGCDHQPGQYAETVRKAHDHFRRGDLFETVPGQVFTVPCRDQPGTIFRRLSRANPAPYGAFMNLGEQEYLVGASPEMFVRVRQRQVETCPISGTIARGRDALEDAEQIRTLLNSDKDLAELSMCTDVDRNDKARVCLPGSVRVKGRRQIEMYSRLIHTVDHVTGTLRPDRDALDAFLSHAWAVTVTGAPKLSAMQFIEDHEQSERRWYGGAMGFLGFNGHMNTGLTLRTMRIKAGMAEVRAGATLLYDSDPEAEERETRLKASALMDAIRGNGASGLQAAGPAVAARPVGEGLKVLMVDHRDSFVHNLVAYFSAHGCDVRTVRPGQLALALAHETPSLVVLSPGPGKPGEAGIPGTLDRVLARGLPVFGVCLGLQGIVEFFGGTLAQLDEPVHGRASRLDFDSDSPLFSGLSQRLSVGRYHSLVAGSVPDCLRVTASTDDGVVMAVAHQELPVSALQFHPESILTMGDAGMQLIGNLLEQLRVADGCAAAVGETVSG